MSFFARLWHRLKSPTGFIGKDLEGNRFHEYPSKHIGGRTRRVVKYARSKGVWESASELRRLPAQWTSWLSHTRANPPTVSELHADSLRIQRVLQNVAVLEAKDREERLRLASPTPPHDGTTALGQHALSERASASPRSGDDTLTKPEVPRETRPGLPDMPRQNDDSPESWTPKVGHRSSQ